ncbi:MAG: SRPBCC family protein [Actinomycetota bacterium]
MSSWKVELEHRVGAPPDVVFDYFTDPEKYRRWKGIDAELDPRPGGIYRVTMRPEVWVSGQYIVVDRPHRLVMTWGFESTLDVPEVVTEVPPGASTVEFTFMPDRDGTIVRVRHAELPSAESVRFHTLGWNNYLERLGDVVEGKDPGVDRMASLGRDLRGRSTGG